MRQLLGPPPPAAHTIRRRVRRELGFTVNVGIAPNRLLAKMASDFEKPDRVHTLYKYEVETKMWPLPVGDQFGVGPSAAKRPEQPGRASATIDGLLSGIRRSPVRQPR